MSATVESNKMNAMNQQRKLVQQLRREAAIQRIKVTTAIEDLKVRIKRSQSQRAYW